MQDGRIKLVRDAVEDWEGLIDICPTGALRYDASCYDVSDILREVKKTVRFSAMAEGLPYPEVSRCCRRTSHWKF